jgi:hypothetical protein
VIFVINSSVGLIMRMADPIQRFQLQIKSIVKVLVSNLEEGKLVAKIEVDFSSCKMCVTLNAIRVGAKLLTAGLM